MSCFYSYRTKKKKKIISNQKKKKKKKKKKEARITLKKFFFAAWIPDESKLSEFFQYLKTFKESYLSDAKSLL